MKKTEPLVSVIMNCYNCERYLKEALDSVCTQTYNNWEIIFWDNASTDSSRTIVQGYNDTRIRYFRGETTVVVYNARNKALEKCNGKFIAFLDCDDIWMKEKLEKQIPLFNDLAVGLVFSDSLFFTDNGYERRNYAKKYPPEGSCFASLLKRYYLDIETVVIRKSMIDQYKLKFDNRFNLVGDADLFTRIAWYSKIALVPDVLAKWRIHANSLTSTQQEGFFIEREQMLENFEKDLIGIVPKYAKELNIAKRAIHLHKAFYEWHNSRGSMARTILLSIPIWDIKVILLFTLTFFPGSFYKFVQYLRGIDHSI